MLLLSGSYESHHDSQLCISSLMYLSFIIQCVPCHPFNQHIERCSISLTIPKSKPGEIRLHNHENVSNKKDHNKSWPGCEGIGSLYPTGRTVKLCLCACSVVSDTGVGYPFLLQGIFLTQGSNSSLLRLLHW